MSKTDWFILIAFVSFIMAGIGIIMYLSFTLFVTLGLWDVRAWLFAIGMVVTCSKGLYFIVTYDGSED